MVSHPYMTTGKMIALTIWTFAGKVMSLLFNELSRFVVYSWASLVAQLVRNPPAMWETWVQSLGWENPLGEGKGYPLQYSGLENSMNCIVSPLGS